SQFGVLVNCGATIDIWETLQPPADFQFYVIDSHRPFHISNFYNQQQVHLLVSEGEEVTVPAYGVVFRDSDDENSDAEDADEDADPDAATAALSAAERRGAPARVAQPQERALLEHEQFTYHGPTSSLLLLEQAFRTSRPSLSALWCAIVGHTWQLLSGRLDWDAYFEAVCGLQAHVTSWRNASSAASASATTLESQLQETISSPAELQFSRCLNLWLLRHWSLEDCMRCSPHTACALQLFGSRGRQRLLQFLADAGIAPERGPAAVRLHLQNGLENSFSRLAGKFKLDPERLFLPTFTAKAAFRPALVATDCALLCACHLTRGDFCAAIDCVTIECSEGVCRDLGLVRDWLSGQVDRAGAGAAGPGSVVNLGPFLFVSLPEAGGRLRCTCWPAGAAGLRQPRQDAAGRPGCPCWPPASCRVRRGPEFSTVFLGLPPVGAEDCRNVFRAAMLEAARGCRALGEAEFDGHAVRAAPRGRQEFCRRAYRTPSGRCGRRSEPLQCPAASPGRELSAPAGVADSATPPPQPGPEQPEKPAVQGLGFEP
uniref:Rab3 GTPase-activating protein catalytic subunit n=1 Tax=Macrostomum lignano TaxID=282301 RepID=A0A1I8JS55_9PLAT